MLTNIFIILHLIYLFMILTISFFVLSYFAVLRNISWSEAGCKVSSTNTTHTVCRCYHLTSFAVLMSVKQDVSTLSVSTFTVIQLCHSMQSQQVARYSIPRYLMFVPVIILHVGLPEVLKEGRKYRDVFVHNLVPFASSIQFSGTILRAPFSFFQT